MNAKCCEKKADDKGVLCDLNRLYWTNGNQKQLQKGKRNNKRTHNNQNRNDYNQKKIKYCKTNPISNNPIRLNKYLANAGLCSRRKADEYIQAGLIGINGISITELGTKVNRTDNITFHNSPIYPKHKVYLLLNKPKNCITTTFDLQGRHTVMDLIKTAYKEKIFPVGRLDRNTTGVLLMTNDGELSDKLTHPKYIKKKIYHAWLNKQIDVTDMKRLFKGIQLEDGMIHVDDIYYINDKDKTQISIEIHSGRNRIIHRIFENLGYRVLQLDRVYFAGLTKENLKKGQWRFLNNQEVAMLCMKKSINI